jgi:hypothetical protein
MDDRERWRPASEVPECTAEADADVIVEFLCGGKLITERANYADEKRGMKPPGFFSEYGDRFDAPITRWRYWPEPPTPEQEERRLLEERLTLVWTTEKPKVPGRYLREQPDGECVVWEITPYTVDYLALGGIPGGRWAGPIPEPREPG